jgi:N6-adenosine-specific RNA methylase IME4
MAYGIVQRPLAPTQALRASAKAARPIDFLARPGPDGAGAILADPPWNFRTWSAKGQGRSPSQHYDVMAFDEIAALPVASIAAKGCWLFLWAPSQHQANAHLLMQRWGFTFSSTAFIWIKTKKDGTGFVFGTGKTTLKSGEICLLGKRGKPRRNSGGVKELILAPRREHSRKPDQQYERVEEFCSGPYVELFARQRWPGWISWGREVGLFRAEAAS